MTVKELKELLKDIPDQAEVYIGDEDADGDIKATEVYYAINGTIFQYRHSITDKNAVKSIEITGFF